MSDHELYKLGVATIGDRIRLREILRHNTDGANLSDRNVEDTGTESGRRPQIGTKCSLKYVYSLPGFCHIACSCPGPALKYRTRRSVVISLRSSGL